MRHREQRLSSLFHSIKQHKYEDTQNGIRHGRQKFVGPTQSYVGTDQPSRNHEADKFVYREEENRQEEASADVLHIQLDTEG